MKIEVKEENDFKEFMSQFLNFWKYEALTSPKTVINKKAFESQLKKFIKCLFINQSLRRITCSESFIWASLEH